VGLRRPRARRRLARGGVRPSSEVETRPRGRQALERSGDSAARRSILERDGDSLEGYRDRPFGGPLRLLGLWALLCSGPQSRGARFVIRGFVTLYFIIFRKGVFYLVIRGPLWLSPTVAPVPLQWYLLGTRRGWHLQMGLSSLLVAVLFRGGALAHPRV
jgi:hypothetical protein